MTKDQITSIARQAGFLIDEAPIRQPYVIQATRYKIDDELQRFAELVRNEVLEEAAKSCNELIEADNSDDYKAGVTWCAMRIEGLKL